MKKSLITFYFFFFVVGCLVTKSFQGVVLGGHVLSSENELLSDSFIFKAVEASNSLINPIVSYLLELLYNPYLISLLLNGLIASLYFVGISTFFRYEKVEKIILGSLIVYVSELYKITFSYDVALIESYSTYGYLGLAISLLVIGLAVREKKYCYMSVSGGLLFFHPAYFFWTITILAPTIISDIKKISIKNKITFFSSFTLVCLGYIAINFKLLSKVFSHKVNLELLRIIDVHRVKLTIESPDLYLLVVSILSFIYFLFIKSNRNRFERIIISLSFSLFVFNLLYQFDLLPEMFIALMPQKLYGIFNMLIVIYLVNKLLMKVTLRLDQRAIKMSLSILLVIFIIKDVYPRIDKSFLEKVLSTQRVKNVDIVHKRVLSFKCEHIIFFTEAYPISAVDWLDVMIFDSELAVLGVDYLSDIYGVDIEDNYDYWNEQGVIPYYYLQNVWQNKKNNDWKKLSQKYKIDFVISPNEWDLDLPFVREIEGCKIYKAIMI